MRKKEEGRGKSTNLVVANELLCETVEEGLASGLEGKWHSVVAQDKGFTLAGDSCNGKEVWVDGSQFRDVVCLLAVIDGLGLLKDLLQLVADHAKLCVAVKLAKVEVWPLGARAVAVEEG